MESLEYFDGVCLLAFAGCHNLGAYQLLPRSGRITSRPRQTGLYSQPVSHILHVCRSVRIFEWSTMELYTPDVMRCTTMGRKLPVNTYNSRETTARTRQVL